jgi:hypothetical protein
MSEQETVIENLTDMLQTGMLGNPNEDATMTANYVKENGPFELTIKGFIKRKYTGKDGKVENAWVMLFKEDVPGVKLNLTRQEKLFEIMGTAQIDQIVSRKIIVCHDPSVKFGKDKVGGVALERAEDLAGA